MPRPRFQPNTPTKRVSSGSVSKPTTPKWRPKAQPAPRVVKGPQTIAPQLMGIAPTGPGLRSISGSWGVGGTIASASLTTALTGSNNDLKYTSKASGSNYSGGNTTRVRYVVAGNSTALSVSVSGQDITVNVATDSGGAATSTAAQVKTAVEASAPAAALVTVALATGNDGTGVVTALAFTNLSGGQDYTVGTSR